MLEATTRDVLFALRTLRKNPAFAVTAVLTLALGIGGNTAIFTVVHAVLLKPLAYQDPDRLVRFGDMTPVRYGETRAAARSFTGVGAYAVVPERMTLSGGAEPESLKGARVSADFLSILGVTPALGRSFLPEEDEPGARPVALISAELWQRRFGGDPRVEGRTATFDATPYTILGVLPPGFAFPFAGVDVWVPKPSEVSVIPPQARSRSGIIAAFARLRPGVTLHQAAAELDVINRQYAQAHPGMVDAKSHTRAHPEPLKEQLVANVRSMLWMLFGAVGFVLLIACANVAGLLLARAASRSREFAVRAALGAGRGHLVRQLLAESMLLACAGGVLGILLATGALHAVAGMSAFNLPRAGEIHLDSAVLAFTAVLSIATGVLFGLVPSLGVSRPDLAGTLRAGGERTGGVSAQRPWLGLNARALLVAGQVALSIVLLIGAALMMESLARLNGVDPGFQPAHLLTMQISLPPARYDTLPKRKAFYDELLRRAGTIPGVRGVALAFTLPMSPWSGSPVQVVGQPLVKFSERPIGRLQVASPDFFRTFEIALRRGREFNAQDSPDAPPVAIVNETFARRFWPAYPRGPEPIGQRILIGSLSGPVEIVGVTADVHDLDADARPEIYRPSGQTAPQSAVFVARTSGDPRRSIHAVRSEVLAIDPDQPVSAVRTMDDVVEASVGPRRLTMTLLGAFAAVALLLAVVGIYGVIAYSVAQRAQEIGIRRALGAQRGDILRLVLGQGLALALAGVAVGIAGAFALTRVMKSLLFHVSPTDPATFGGIALLFIAAALAAGYLPARRAMRADPMAALRGR